MSAALTTITTEAGKVTFDADIPIGVLEDIQTASTAGNIGALRLAFSQFVTEWDLKGDPTNADDWKALRKSEFQAVIKGVSEALAAEGN